MCRKRGAGLCNARTHERNWNDDAHFTSEDFFPRRTRQWNCGDDDAVRTWHEQIYRVCMCGACAIFISGDCVSSLLLRKSTESLSNNGAPSNSCIGTAVCVCVCLCVC